MLCRLVDGGIANEALPSLRHFSRSSSSQVDLCSFESSSPWRQFVKKSTKIMSRVYRRGKVHDKPKHQVSPAALTTHERQLKLWVISRQTNRLERFENELLSKNPSPVLPFGVCDRPFFDILAGALTDPQLLPELSRPWAIRSTEKLRQPSVNNCPNTYPLPLNPILLLYKISHSSPYQC
jgi:hypothetical protein